jgi:cbb3-type cytochrome oxidase subunit 1
MGNLKQILWFKLAALYFLCGVGLGLHMAKSGNHGMFPVHAHLNLLGWVSMALFGLIYQQFPAMSESKLASAHFWIYNLAFPVQMTTLYLFLSGNVGIEPVLGFASMAVGFAILLFVVNVFKNAN